MSSAAVDKKLFICFIDILKGEKIDWLTEICIPLPSKILKEVTVDQFCKMTLNLELFLRKTRVILFSIKVM
jgi:hypothetical protein